MGKDKIRTELTREQAADKLAEIAEQLRKGGVSLGGKKGEITVPDMIEFKAGLDDDELEIELRWESD
jgi:amphi-Trp domain-containing protein